MRISRSTASCHEVLFCVRYVGSSSFHANNSLAPPAYHMHNENYLGSWKQEMNGECASSTQHKVPSNYSLIVSIWWVEFFKWFACAMVCCAMWYIWVDCGSQNLSDSLSLELELTAIIMDTDCWMANALVSVAPDLWCLDVCTIYTHTVPC